MTDALREALQVASYALEGMTPCAAAECQAEQSEDVQFALRTIRTALQEPAPVVAREPATTEYMVELSGELVRQLCMKVCDDVGAVSPWTGDPTDKEKRFKAGTSAACEEIKYRIEHMDLTASLQQCTPVAAQAPVEPAPAFGVPERNDYTPVNVHFEDGHTEPLNDVIADAKKWRAQAVEPAPVVQPEPEAWPVEWMRRWPFVESPGEIADRMHTWLSDDRYPIPSGVLLAAVRYALIERDTTLYAAPSQLVEDARDKAIEECAMVCESLGTAHRANNDHRTLFNTGTEACARAIRSIAKGVESC